MNGMCVIDAPLTPHSHFDAPVFFLEVALMPPYTCKLLLFFLKRLSYRPPLLIAGSHCRFFPFSYVGSIMLPTLKAPISEFYIPISFLVVS